MRFRSRYNVLILLLSVLWSGTSFSQEEVREIAVLDSTVESGFKRHSLKAVLELGGLTTVPLSAEFSKSVDRAFRFESGFNYLYKEVIGVEVRYFQDEHLLTSSRNTIRDYSARSSGLLLGIKCTPLRGKKMKGGLIIGQIIGRAKENGVITIGGDYFEPYTDRRETDSRFVGLRAAIDFEYCFTDRWSLRLETGYTGAEYSDPDEELIMIYVPSSYESSIASRSKGGVLGAKLLLCFDL